MSIDVRSRLGRRVADLAEDFAQRLGGWASLSDTMIASIRRAAELSSLAEEVRTNALRDGNIDPIGLDWFASASRAVRALQLDRPREPEPMRSRNISPPMALLSPGRRASRQAGVVRETRRTARRPTGKGHPARRPRASTTEAASDQDRAPRGSAAGHLALHGAGVRHRGPFAPAAPRCLPANPRDRGGGRTPRSSCAASASSPEQLHHPLHRGMP